jgi:hypothetical protein
LDLRQISYAGPLLECLASFLAFDFTANGYEAANCGGMTGFCWFLGLVFIHHSSIPPLSIAPNQLLQLCVVTQQAIVSVNIAHELGRHIMYVSLPNLDIIGRNGNVGSMIAIFAFLWSKTSFALTLLRFTEGWMKAFLWFVIVILNICAVLGALILWVRCTPIDKAWNPIIEGTCWNPNVYIYYGYVSGSLSAAFDIILSILPWKIIWHMQMRPGERVGAGIAMSLGILSVFPYKI